MTNRSYLLSAFVTSVCIAISSPVIASTENARDEQESVSNVVRLRVIAQLEQYSGFVPPTYPNFKGVFIYSNGQVVYTRRYYNKPQKTVVIATLSPLIARSIHRAAQSVRPGELIDRTPTDPVCADAPSTLFTAVKSNGTKIKLLQTKDCKTYGKAEMSHHDSRVISALEGALNLANTIDN